MRLHFAGIMRHRVILRPAAALLMRERQRRIGISARQKRDYWPVVKMVILSQTLC